MNEYVDLATYISLLFQSRISNIHNFFLIKIYANISKEIFKNRKFCGWSGKTWHPNMSNLRLEMGSFDFIEE